MSELRIPKVSELAPTFGGKSAPIDKVQKYGWTMSGSNGSDAEIHKDDLKVDYTYQRDTISSSRIAKITQEWNWTKVGRLVVSKRASGEYFVVDGQHRLLAAKQRSDVRMLPCIVYKFATFEEEALAFRDINCNRGPVSAYHQFRASLAGGDSMSRDIVKVVERNGYTISANRSKSDHGRTIRSIAFLRKCMTDDHAAAVASIQAACAIADGRHIPDTLMRGLYRLQKHLQQLKLGSVTDPDIIKKLKLAGLDEIARTIASTKALLRATGNNSCAQGLLNIINRRKQKRIPDVTGSDN